MRGFGTFRGRGVSIILGLTVIAGTVACGGGETVGSGSTTPAADTPAAAGKSLAQRVGCIACHSPNGSGGAGPTWKGLYERQTTFTDGSTAVADEAYIKQSITDPNARIVKGYSTGVMPPTYKTLSDEQLDQLVAYIKTLK